jgi:hypothetical protein
MNKSLVMYLTLFHCYQFPVLRRCTVCFILESNKESYLWKSILYRYTPSLLQKELVTNFVETQYTVSEIFRVLIYLF